MSSINVVQGSVTSSAAPGWVFGHEHVLFTYSHDSQKYI